MSDKSTLADYLQELGVDVKNMQEFLNKLSQMLSTSSDSVSVNQTLQDGTSKTFVVPSFAYLTNKINAIDDKFTSLLTGNAGRIGVLDENGLLRNFELQDVSQVISDLDSVSAKSVSLPTNFKYKPNWFFESFLNPLLYIDVPVDNIVTSDIDSFEVNRVIITSTVQSDLDYFDSAYKGKNNVSYSDAIRDLGGKSISYFEDSNIVSIPPAKNRVSGSFDILNILSDVSAKVVLNETQTIATSKYILNTLRYMEKAASAPTGVVHRTLKVGDSLITSDNSEYKVAAVDVAQNGVTLTRVFGLGDLTAGAAKLRIKPSLTPIKYVPLNVGYNERELIFLRPFSSRLNISTQSYSLGFGVYTNELTITLNDGTISSLADFYASFVSDFGLMFLDYAKNKKVPPSLGEVPNSVVLSSDHFKVVQVDQHIQSAQDINTVKQNIASLENIKSQITEIDRQISNKRAQLNTSSTLTESEQLKLNRDLKTLSDQRLTLSTSQASKVSSVTTTVKGAPLLIKAPTYAVKGFFHIPEPITTATGVQNVVQFKTAYRILSTTGTSETAEQITFMDAKGNKVVGSFSPWKEMLGKPRTKTYNETSGLYEWADENVADPDTVNCNQIELPINKGEVLEIRVKSLSEAGWPDNPIESAWSNSILIEFPASMQTMEDISIISQQAFAEEAKINFQNDLNAKGLDLHLSTSFTSKDKYFPHKAEDIASGYFTPEGTIIDLFSKLKSITDTLTAIQTSISSGTGVLKVSLIDQSGNKVTVNNGQTIQLFAGYYKDLIKKTSGTTTTYDHGKIITAQYFIQLENTSQSPLQLIASINGGTGEMVPTSNPYATDGYNMNLRYDLAPITIANSSATTIAAFKQMDGYQSAQSKGQIFYRRYKSMNLGEVLVDGDRKTTNVIYDSSYNIDYQYGGTMVNSSNRVPYSAGHYLPYDPTLQTLSIKVNGVDYNMSSNASVWKGTVSGSPGTPVGGGLLSEFCIATDHPDLKAGGRYNDSWSAIKRPSLTTQQVALPFSHAIHFETSEMDATDVFGSKYFVQAAYKPISSGGTTNESYYPIKQGFQQNDKYLIGKYTCGAYLYVAPTSYESIAATAYSPSTSKRLIEVGEANALRIPLVFQYRCSDYLKYVGGFRANTTSGLRNVKYTKQIGFDIQLSNEVFSFDVIASAQYEKETAVVTPVSQVSQTGSMSQISLTS